MKGMVFMKFTKNLVLVLFCVMLIFTFGCKTPNKSTASVSNSTTPGIVKNSASKSAASSTPTIAASPTVSATNSQASPVNTADPNKQVVKISQNKTYEASSVWPDPGYETDKAFDDDEETRWSAIVESDSWISIDFGGDYNITAISFIECKQWCQIGDYTVQVFSGNQWKDAYTSESLEIENGEMININKVTGSKLKILFNSQLKTAATFFDISVYGYK